MGNEIFYWDGLSRKKNLKDSRGRKVDDVKDEDKKQTRRTRKREEAGKGGGVWSAGVANTPVSKM